MSSGDEDATRNVSAGDAGTGEHGTSADSVAARQTLLALFIDDRNVEKWVRHHPREAAERYAVSSSFAQWLANLPVPRVRQFRRSRVHKQRLRDGASPTLLDD